MTLDEVKKLVKKLYKDELGGNENDITGIKLMDAPAGTFIIIKEYDYETNIDRKYFDDYSTDANARATVLNALRSFEKVK